MIAFTNSKVKRKKKREDLDLVGVSKRIRDKIERSRTFLIFSKVKDGNLRGKLKNIKYSIA